MITYGVADGISSDNKSAFKKVNVMNILVSLVTTINRLTHLRAEIFFVSPLVFFHNST